MNMNMNLKPPMKNCNKAMIALLLITLVVGICYAVKSHASQLKTLPAYSSSTNQKCSNDCREVDY